MADINDLIKLTEQNRALDAAKAAQIKTAETSSKLREATLSTFLKAAEGMVGATPNGKQALQLLTPFFGIAALGKALTEGFLSNMAASSNPQTKNSEDNLPHAPAIVNGGLTRNVA